MKVSIITEGFHNTGYGHITRCFSIYQAFEERDIFPTMYINGDYECKTFIPNARHEIIDWSNNPDLLFKKISDSEIVIVDSYLAKIDFYKKISSITSLTSLPAFIDDNVRLDYPAGVVINGSINAELMGYQKKAGVLYLLGAKYIPLRKEFWTTREKQIRAEVQSVLITFGGQDLQNLTPRTLGLLVRNHPEVRKKVVVGIGFKNADQINEVKDKSTEIFYSPSACDMLKIMLDSDVAISGAGQTIYELARVGVPTIAVAVAENQKNNITGWLKEEFLTTDINYQNINLESKLLLTFLNYKKRTVRQKLSALGRKKIDGFGAKRIVQSLIDQIIARNAGFYLRRALEKDATRVFNLSNERIVRLNSINQSPIIWSEHLEWYSNKINDPNTLFFLAFNSDDEFVGQVRFDVKSNYAAAGISITKDFRGKGLSTSLLINTSFRCLKEKPGVEYILAYIKPTNTPSIKSFLKATYNFSHEEILQGEKFLAYKLLRKR